MLIKVFSLYILLYLIKHQSASRRALNVSSCKTQLNFHSTSVKHEKRFFVIRLANEIMKFELSILMHRATMVFMSERASEENCDDFLPSSSKTNARKVDFFFM